MRQANATLTVSASNESYFVAFETFVIEDAVEAEVMRRDIGSRLLTWVLRLEEGVFDHVPETWSTELIEREGLKSQESAIC